MGNNQPAERVELPQPSAAGSSKTPYFGDPVGLMKEGVEKKLYG